MKTNSTKKKSKSIDPALKAIERHRVMSYAELAKHGATGTKLRRMTEAGLIVPLGSGLYASIKLDPFVASVIATAKYYPKAVISGLTALQIYELGQDYAQKIDVDIARETSLRNRMLKVHRVPQSRLIGIASLKYHGAKIRIYDIERTLCEAYKLDRAGPLFFKALKRYIARGKIGFAKIQLYDKALKTQVMKHLQQELADV